MKNQQAVIWVLKACFIIQIVINCYTIRYLTSILVYPE